MRYKGKHCKDNGKSKYRTLGVVMCILVVAVAIAAGGVYSKYKETVTLDSVNLTVSSGKLADVFTLQEHKAVQNSNGTYSLGTAVVTSNNYRVLPGVALPKDPYITLTGKSKVASYLYLEIIDNANGTDLSYSLTDDWMDLNLTGDKGGKVYVYTGGKNTAALLKEDFSDEQLFILENNQITVSKANKSSLDVTISFYGYLAQASLADNARDVYTTCFGGGN